MWFWFIYEKWCWKYFCVFIGHLCIFFGKMSTQVIYPCFICIICLFIMEIWVHYILKISSLNVFPPILWVIFFTLLVILFTAPYILFKALIFDTHQQKKNYWNYLTRTISQSTFNSVATASIFSLQTEPRLVMPLSQYFLRVAKSRSLNWVRSCSCKTHLKELE